MAITNEVSVKFAQEFFNNEHNLAVDNLKAILINTLFPGFNPSTHSKYSDISTYEIAAGFGYLKKTKALSNVSINAASNYIILNCDNLIWPAVDGDISPASGCIIINDTHVNDTVVCCIEFGANYQAIDGTALSINLSNGLLQLDINPNLEIGE